MQLFFDESGFTGQDLANREQPIFVLASTRAGDDLCHDIYSEVFKDVKARELKHSSLAKTPRGRDRIMKFLRRVRGSGLFQIGLFTKNFVSFQSLLTYVWNLLSMTVESISTIGAMP